MKTDPQEIYDALSALLKAQTPPLRIRTEKEGSLEVCGTKEAMQGKQKVDGYYFATAMLKPKDCRLYFFPIYTHVDEFADVPDTLRKCLKGKSCFHIKKLDDELQTAIEAMVKQGVALYQRDDLI